MFFFFKQKTAYERRISDWSSDVCSSDLYHRHFVAGRPVFLTLVCHARMRSGCRSGGARLRAGGWRRAAAMGVHAGDDLRVPAGTAGQARRGRLQGSRSHGAARAGAADRSEEHTSELQSLMRSSYAIFCLKNTNTEKIQQK